MAEDDFRRFLGLFWAARASQPTQKSENETPCVFFHCAFDYHAPGRRNIIQKLNKYRKTKNFEIEFLKIENIVRIDAPMYFLEAATPKTHPKYFKKTIFTDFTKIAIFIFYILINFL